MLSALDMDLDLDPSHASTAELLARVDEIGHEPGKRILVAPYVLELKRRRYENEFKWFSEVREYAHSKAS